VAAAAEHRLTAIRGIGSTDSILDVDKSARCVICRNHSGFAASAPLAAVVAAGFVIYLA
jgi:hypothetical protein